MKLFFIGWDKPLSELVAPKLLDSGYRYGNTASLDLSRILVLIPGHGAAKALNTKMTALTEEISGGIFPPVYMTPEEFLLAGAPPAVHPASELEQLRAWKLVLAECDRSRFLTLFPVEFPLKSEDVFLYLAKQLNQLKRELSAGGLTIADIRDRCHEDLSFSASPERWDELAELERLYFDKLKSLGLCDPETLKLQLSSDAGAFREFKRIIVIGMPDISELAVRRIEAASKLIETEIWINAPEELHSFFDEWGRPVSEKWCNYPLSFGKCEDSVTRIFKAGTFGEVAVLASAMLKEFGPDLNDCAVAVTDEQFLYPLQKAFSRLTIKESGKELLAIQSSGVTMKKLRLFDLLNRFSRFIVSESFNDAVLFLRHFDVLTWISEKTSMKAEKILNELDDLRNDHLPDTLSSAVQLCSALVKPLLDFLIECRKMWLKMVPVQAVRDLFSQLYDGRPTIESSGISLEDELDALKPYLRIMEKSPLFSGETIDAAIAELLEVCGDIRLYREPHDNEFFISGFLDMPWSDAKRIILLGMNEEYIPENVFSSTFLSDSMRMKLGLQCNARRKGRDTLYLEALLNSRGAENMRFLASSVDPKKKPLKISSLLFQCCSDEDLISRASVLYEPMRFPERKTSSAGQGFVLCPDYSRVPDFNDIIIPVTQFKNYLASPFRFFLYKYVHMTQTEYDPMEMSSSSFGTFCHKVLQLAPRSRDPETMKKNILETMDLLKCEVFGSPVPVLPAIQLEKMKQRLLHAAAIFAKTAEEFTVVETEFELGGKQGYMKFEGGKIQGKIDCIEYSPSQNLLRLIDYKTSSTDKTPERAHYNDSKGFTDLQLPLYRLLLECNEEFRALHPEIDFSTVRILCGYFNLPSDVTKTGYSFWENMDQYLSDARSLVRQIFEEIKEMRDGIFYEDETKKVSYDAYDFCLRPTLSQAVPSITLKSKDIDHE